MKMKIQSRQKHIERLDKKYMWHPFTQMQEWSGQSPLIITEGRGSFVKDASGRWYIDGISSLWVTVHGHRKVEIDTAIKEQVDSISHSTLLGYTNPLAPELAEKLVQITPDGLSRVFYSDNGSTAVEVGLKIAYQYWQQMGVKGRKKFLSLKNAYHGDTIGAVSVGGIDLFHKVYSPLLFKAFKAPSPYCYRCELGKKYPACRISCLKQTEQLLKKHHNEIAALIIEPLVQGAAGMIMSPPRYLKGIEKLCRRYNVLLIVDEVATGFGRTGMMFACDHEGVRPDIMCLAKGITGGYLPLAATMTTEKIYRAFLGRYEDRKTFFHGHTYSGNQLACAAALASLGIFRRERTLQKLKSKIAFLRKSLDRVADMPHVGEVRQKGFMVGIELVSDRRTKEPYPLAERMGWKVCGRARDRGVLIRPLGDVIVLMPPLSISRDELKSLLQVTAEAIQEITS